jgi:hypothetical protein
MFYDLNAEFQEILLNINISIMDRMRKIMGIYIFVEYFRIFCF